MQNLLRDLRHGIQALRSDFRFSSVAILALMLGIGVTTAIFTVANTVLLRPLPYAHPERIITIWSVNPKLHLGYGKMANSAGQFVDYKDQSQVFNHIAAFAPGALNLEGKGEAERISTTRVTADFFATLGVNAALGRLFLPEEDQPGRNQVVILSHSLWQRRFGSDPTIIGQGIQLSGTKYTVVGIMPPGFNYPRGTDMPDQKQFDMQTDIWRPVGLTAHLIEHRGPWNFSIIAHLKPGVTVEQAQKQLSEIAARNEQRYPKTDAGTRVLIIPMHEQIVGNLKPAILMLLGAAGIVLLIACANVANLLMVRMVARQKEIAIRSALGASSLRIIQQLFTENTLLWLIGSLFGCILAFWGVKLLGTLAPVNIPRIKDVSIDPGVISFALFVTILTGIIFGLAPALNALKTNINKTLRQGGREGNRRRYYISGVLVVAEVALALTLLIGMGLIVRSVIQLYQLDLGINPDKALTMRLNMTDKRYPKEAQRMAFYNQIIQRIQALPGVSSVAGTYAIPLTGNEIKVNFLTANQTTIKSAENMPTARWNVVTVDYFRTVMIPLMRGRVFTERDDSDAPGVVVINEALAQRYFPGVDPIGKRINIGAESKGPWQSIIGVVRNVKTVTFNDDPGPELYVPYLQRPSWGLGIIIRTVSDPDSIAEAARNEIWAVDKDMPVFNISSMNQIFSRAISTRRFTLLLLSLCSVIALMLAMVGIYGVTSYWAIQRTREISIRMALGCKRYGVIKMILGQIMVLVLIGLAIGSVTAFALTRFMKSLLFEISSTDQLTFVMAGALLAGVALLSTLIPAHRATKTDPLIALRSE